MQFNEFNQPPYVIHHYGEPRRKYGFFKFFFDVFMFMITGGFWLIWVFVREMRAR